MIAGNLCCITYLHPAGKARGGTEVIPGTHRSADRSSEHLRLGTVMEEEGRLSRRSVEGLDEVLPGAVSPDFQPGDVLLFDSWVLHRVSSSCVQTSHSEQISHNEIYHSWTDSVAKERKVCHNWSSC